MATTGSDPGSATAAARPGGTHTGPARGAGTESRGDDGVRRVSRRRTLHVVRSLQRPAASRPASAARVARAWACVHVWFPPRPAQQGGGDERDERTEGERARRGAERSGATAALSYRCRSWWWCSPHTQPRAPGRSCLRPPRHHAVAAHAAGPGGAEGGQRLGLGFLIHPGPLSP
eukprot:scaffold217_cov377-Prasinococcus_capsulatus_cf.AAC.30